MRGEFIGGLQEGKNNLKPENVTLVRETKRLIDDLELYGQTVLNNDVFKLAVECWTVFDAVALLENVPLNVVMKVAESTEENPEGVCPHPKTVCPEHNGSFDCTPFCRFCEGEQEYCPTCLDEI